MDREQAPLGEGPIPLLTRGLEMLGVDSEELAEADFSAGNIAKNETELPNEELDLARASVEPIGMVPHAFGRRARRVEDDAATRRVFCACR